MAHTLSSIGSAKSSPTLRLDSDAVMEARIELAACFQLAAQYGFEEESATISRRSCPDTTILFFADVQYGYAFSEITASRLQSAISDGHVVSGKGKAARGQRRFISTRLHRLKPRVKAAFHTHMPNATALCLLDGPPLLRLRADATLFYGRTAVDENYNGLALDDSEGDRIAATIGDADILFLKNHGRDGGRRVLPKRGMISITWSVRLKSS